MTYTTNIFGHAEDPFAFLRNPDTTSLVKTIQAMYLLGGLMDQATDLRTQRTNGHTLTDAEVRFITRVDHLLDVGIEAFIAEDPR